jgi:NDMA-dependent alcohol dehydrogenase
MTRAAVLRTIGAPLTIEDIEVESPHPGEVAVRIAASGVCHSDLSMQNGKIPFPLPAVLGHEGAGVVEAVGDGVTSVAPGDHVVISWVPQCGTCFFCAYGQPELCEIGRRGMAKGGMLDGTSRLSRGEETLFQMNVCGTFTELTVTPEQSVVKIDPDMPLDRAALIGCGVLTGFGAVKNAGRVRAGDTVAVLGCGGVGLNAIQGARHAGAERIIAVDRFDTKLALARRFGATDTVDATAGDPVAAVKELTGGRGVDAAFEVVGTKTTIEQTIRMTRRGGRAVLVGMPSFDLKLELAVGIDLFLMERSIAASMYGGSDVRRDVPMLVDLYQRGDLELDALISRRIGLDGVNDAFIAMEAGAVARSVITFDA